MPFLTLSSKLASYPWKMRQDSVELKTKISLAEWLMRGTISPIWLSPCTVLTSEQLPSNLVQACFQQAQTTYVTKEVATGTASEITQIQEATLVYKDGTNVMGMIVFCITFGLVAGQFGAKGKFYWYPIAVDDSARNVYVVLVIVVGNRANHMSNDHRPYWTLPIERLFWLVEFFRLEHELERA